MHKNLSPLEVDKMKCPLIMSLLAGCLPAEPSDIKPPRWNDFCTDKSPQRRDILFAGRTRREWWGFNRGVVDKEPTIHHTDP